MAADTISFQAAMIERIGKQVRANLPASGMPRQRTDTAIFGRPEGRVGDKCNPRPR
jgi:hypothetical protein